MLKELGTNWSQNSHSLKSALNLESTFNPESYVLPPKCVLGPFVRQSENGSVPLQRAQRRIIMCERRTIFVAETKLPTMRGTVVRY